MNHLLTCQSLETYVYPYKDTAGWRVAVSYFHKTRIGIYQHYVVFKNINDKSIFTEQEAQLYASCLKKYIYYDTHGIVPLLRIDYSSGWDIEFNRIVAAYVPSAKTLLNFIFITMTYILYQES